MRYSDSIIEEVKNRTSLVELVSERTEVRQSGKNFSACCPFHSEKTPSFNINEEQGLYYCFGCGKKGNTFTLVMETRGMTFPEALRFLAQRNGVVLPVPDKAISSREKSLAVKKNLYRKIQSEVQNYFEDALWDRLPGEMPRQGQKAKEYLLGRGISEQTMKNFRLGYASGKPGELLSFLSNSIRPSFEISPSDLEQALVDLGLLRRQSADAPARELFRERVMFPICRSDNLPIAFGGRSIIQKPDIPKYINSPESPIYEKRRSFFGLPQGLSSAQKKKQVLLVEGYTDVLSLAQIEIDNVLAVCGTALTEDHAKILARFVGRVQLVFDGDTAGRLAAARAFPIFLNSGLEVIPLFLPNGEDPDSLARQVVDGKLSRDNFLELLSRSEGSLLKLYLQAQAAEVQGLARGNLSELSSLKASEAGKLAEKIARVLAGVINPVALDLRIKQAADLLGSSHEALKEIVTVQKQLMRKHPIRPDGSRTAGSKKDNISNNRGSNRVAIKTVEPAAPPETPTLPSGTRRMKEIKRQLTLAALVDPSILLSASVQSQIQTCALDDERLLSLFATLRRNLQQRKDGASNLRGLAQLLHSSESESREIVAEIHGYLCQVGLENEKFLEEALKQITMGGAEYKSLISELGDTVERAQLSDAIAVLRTREGKEFNEEGKLQLAQEKLIQKRKLDQLAAKSR